MQKSRRNASEDHFIFLCTKQKKHFKRILDELRKHQKKVGHWSWWVFPTELAGRSEPLPPTRVTMDNAYRLFMEGSPLWKDILELICDLIDKKTISTVIPSRLDQDRVESFVRFWVDVQGPEWFDGILSRLASRFGISIHFQVRIQQQKRILECCAQNRERMSLLKYTLRMYIRRGLQKQRESRLLRATRMILVRKEMQK